MGVEKATFGAGCFWGVESEFKKLKGVVSTAVGYSGGTFDHPTYQDVCSGKTGHAEVVEVTYDPSQITYNQLLSAFWSMHNPTTLNRQGPDIGAQYRSIILFHTPQQEKEAIALKAQLESSGKYTQQIVTEIVPASDFYRAEEYHQCYFDKHKHH